MGQSSAVPASDLAAPSTLESPTHPVRFQVRTVLWGDRRRYEVVDTGTDTTVVVRATRWGADDDVIVLNMGGKGGPQVLESRVSNVVEQIGTRQCGRCRGVFPADPADDPAGQPDWWLCEPCRRTLIGRPARPASADVGTSRPSAQIVPVV